MNTWTVHGHDWAVEMLQRHVADATLRHAYLLTGPSSVGRRTMALRLAQALNCTNPLAPGVPCRSCRACKQIEAGQFIDLMVIQADGEGGTLKVDQIREVTKFLSLKPYQSQYKIVLFLRFQEANVNAQNALLKTLEEAPDYAILLLTADNVEQLLPTIVSRCEILRLRPLTLKEVEEFLTLHGVESEKADLLAHLAGGRPGYALRLAQDEKVLAFRAEKLEDLRHLLSDNLGDRFHYAEKLAKDKDIFRQTLFIWLSYWRDVLLNTSGASATLTNIDHLEEIEELCGRVDRPLARTITVGIENAIEKLDRNLNARLLAEVTLMDWPRIK